MGTEQEDLAEIGEAVVFEKQEKLADALIAERIICMDEIAKRQREGTAEVENAEVGEDEGFGGAERSEMELIGEIRDLIGAQIVPLQAKLAQFQVRIIDEHVHEAREAVVPDACDCE